MLLATPADYCLYGASFQVRRERLPLAGPTFTTVDRIDEIVKKWSGDPQVRELAEKITSWTEQHNTRQQAKAIFDWVRSHTRYVRDPVSTELLRTPDVIIQGIVRDGFAALDCDDYVVFLGALLASLGIPVRAKKIGFSPVAGTYQHIYIEVKAANGFDQRDDWVPLDPTFPATQAGLTWRNGQREIAIPLGEAKEQFSCCGISLGGLIKWAGVFALAYIGIKGLGG